MMASNQTMTCPPPPPPPPQQYHANDDALVTVVGAGPSPLRGGPTPSAPSSRRNSQQPMPVTEVFPIVVSSVAPPSRRTSISKSNSIPQPCGASPVVVPDLGLVRVGGPPPVAPTSTPSTAPAAGTAFSISVCPPPSPPTRSAIPAINPQHKPTFGCSPSIVGAGVGKDEDEIAFSRAASAICIGGGERTTKTAHHHHNHSLMALPAAAPTVTLRTPDEVNRRCTSLDLHHFPQQAFQPQHLPNQQQLSQQQRQQVPFLPPSSPLFFPNALPSGVRASLPKQPSTSSLMTMRGARSSTTDIISRNESECLSSVPTSYGGDISSRNSSIAVPMACDTARMSFSSIPGSPILLPFCFPPVGPNSAEVTFSSPLLSHRKISFPRQTSTQTCCNTPCSPQRAMLHASAQQQQPQTQQQPSPPRTASIASQPVHNHHSHHQHHHQHQQQQQQMLHAMLDINQATLPEHASEQEGGGMEADPVSALLGDRQFSVGSSSSPSPPVRSSSSILGSATNTAQELSDDYSPKSAGSSSSSAATSGCSSLAQHRRHSTCSIASAPPADGNSSTNPQQEQSPKNANDGIDSPTARATASSAAAVAASEAAPMRPARPLSDYRKYKTEMCKHFETTGACPYGSGCLYAHGDAELRSETQNEVLKLANSVIGPSDQESNHRRRRQKGDNRPSLRKQPGQQTHHGQHHQRSPPPPAPTFTSPSSTALSLLPNSLPLPMPALPLPIPPLSSLAGDVNVSAFTALAAATNPKKPTSLDDLSDFMIKTTSLTDIAFFPPASFPIPPPPPPPSSAASPASPLSATLFPVGSALSSSSSSSPFSSGSLSSACNTNTMMMMGLGSVPSTAPPTMAPPQQQSQPTAATTTSSASSSSSNSTTSYCRGLFLP